MVSLIIPVTGELFEAVLEQKFPSLKHKNNNKISYDTSTQFIFSQKDLIFDHLQHE